MKLTDAFANPDNKAETYTDDGINKDIRDYMQKKFPQAVKQAKNSYKFFKGKTEKETAAKIWLFLKNHCKYRRDKDTHQIIRLPSFFVSRKPHYGDCKTFAMFARSVYASIYPDLPTSFKFTAYKNGATIPTHVYTVVKNRDGREFIIDGCWNDFNSEKIFTLALPLNFKTMRITSLSSDLKKDNLLEILRGINDNHPEQRQRIMTANRLRNDVNYLQAQYDGGHIDATSFRNALNEISDEMNGIAKKLSQEEKAARKKKRKEKAKKFFKGLMYGVKFASLAPIRGAFMSIVAMNVNGLASNMKLALDSGHFNPIKDFWHKAGGLDKAMLKGIKIGTSHKPLWLSKKAKAKYEARVKTMKASGQIKGIGALSGGVMLCDELNSIGIAPAVAAAVLAMGASLLAGLLPVLMKALKAGGHNAEAEVVEAQGGDMVQENKDGTLYQAAVTDGGELPDNTEDLEPVEGIGDNTALFAELGKIAESGVKLIGGAIEKKAKKNPKLAKVLNTAGQTADDYFTGAYIRKAGYKDKWNTASSMFGKIGIKEMGLAALVLFLVMRKKK